jgi:hypothetical protein
MVLCVCLKKCGNQAIIKRRRRESGGQEWKLRTLASINSNEAKDFFSMAVPTEGVRDFGEFKGFRL